jgi:cell division transport system ATP-binding protein
MDLLEKACVQGTTVFVATHDHDLVRRRKKRHVTLAGGQIFADSIEANL